MKTVSVAADNLDKRELLKILTAFKRGNFSVRMPVEQTGLAGKIADALNDGLELNEKMTRGPARASNSGSKESKIYQRASIGRRSGGWAECRDALNRPIGGPVGP